MSALRVLIVDDEPLARRRLEQHLAKIEDATCIGTASGCREGLAMTDELKPDVVLLDIKMRDGTGFDYIDAVTPEVSPCIVFVTAFDRHAVKAFEANATDFLVKPVELGRLRAAIARARHLLEQRSRAERTGELQDLVASLRQSLAAERRVQEHEDEIWVRQRVSGFVRVAVRDIEWIAAEDDYVRLNVGERSHLLRGTLKDLERRLDPGQFVRIHRSTIVRADIITEFRREGLNMLAILMDGTRLAVGRVQARRIRQLLLSSERHGRVIPEGFAACED